MLLPTLQVDALFHVGLLDISQKKPESYEGNCLSVSLCPEAWRDIARLRGDCFRLAKPGAQFLDVNAFLDSPSGKNTLLRYGEQEGLISERTIFKVKFVG